jgi:hypothetical protein
MQQQLGCGDMPGKLSILSIFHGDWNYVFRPRKEMM